MADDPAWDMEVPGDRERHTLLGPQGGSPAPVKPTGFRRWWPLGLMASATAILVAAIAVNMLSGPPSPEDLLDQAEAAIAEGRLDDGQMHLESVMAPGAELGMAVGARYHALAADLVRARQDRLGGWEPANAERIIKHLESAKASQWDLSGSDWENLAMARVVVGEYAAAEAALESLAAMPDETIPLRAMMVRSALARAVEQQPGIAGDRRLRILRDLRDDPLAVRDDMEWAAASIAGIRLDAGDPAAAAMGLHRDIRRLEGRGEAASPTLLILLGRSQRDLARPAAAEPPLHAGLNLAASLDPIRGEAMVLLGDIKAQGGDLETARDWYARSMTEYPAADSMLAALVGHARMLDELGDLEGAMQHFGEVARRLERGDGHRDVDVASLESILLDRFEAALTHARTEHALDMARLAASLRPADHRSARISTALAVAAGQVAAERTAVLDQRNADWDDEAWATVLALHAEAGQAHLAAAAAEREAAADDEAWANAMFQAGVHLDAAGQQQAAAAVFLDYVNARDERDPRRIEAMFHMAQAMEAELFWEEATDWYDTIIGDHPRSLQATRSYVPSARCLLAMGRDDDARCRLQSVVDGETPLTPGAPDYRETLVMLGRLCAAAGDYPEAVSRLREAADRWPEHSEATAVLFDIASARRALALDIDVRLATETLTPSTRQGLEADRLANLWEAAVTFEQVMERLADELDPTAMSRGMHRAAAVSRADCLLETGRLQEAIAGYESVARTWPDHPAAMHALVQVATAWTRLGQRERADAAHRRALARLDSLPDDVLDREDGFMSREVWERWMDTVPVGSSLYAGVEDGP
ncbi:MAG: hypothetical protein MK116_01320 [Phycisphaerales bacterium]|nr:hypothetical protein [Phycisphaerales bacterium]